jgi:glycosyltransferase involved in cell wall biosynthesis
MTKSTHKKPQKIICLVPTLDSSLFELRLKNPLELCSKLFNWNITFRLLSDCTGEMIMQGDVFIVQRDANQFVVEVIQLIKRMGKPIIFDIDDLLTELPDFLSHHQLLIDNQYYLQQALKESTVVSTTTKRLSRVLQKYNDNINIIPNCVECSTKDVISHSNVKSKEVSLIVASSDKVLVDMVIESIFKIQKQLGVKVITIGPISLEFIKAGITVEQYEIMPYEDFLNLIRNTSNLIGIIPLDNSVFSSCKSPIKYFDYSLAGVPTLASNLPPYLDFIENENTGLLVNNNNNAWFNAIKEVILSSQKRSHLADMARYYVVENYSLEYSAKLWNDTIEQAIELHQKSLIQPTDLTLGRQSPSFIRLLRYVVSLSSYKKALIFYRKHGLLRLIRFVLFR